MTISQYDIIIATNTEELNAAVADGGYSPVGAVYTHFGLALQAVGEGVLDFGIVSDYQFVKARSPKELVPLVMEKINEGLQPVGGVVVWEQAYIQGVGFVTASGGGGGGGGDYVLPMASVTELGGVRMAIDAPIAGTVMSPSSVDGRSYMVQKDPTGHLFVNVPWTGGGTGEEATEPNQFVPLFQVEAMIAASRKSIEDGIIDIINGAIGQ